MKNKNLKISSLFCSSYYTGAKYSLSFYSCKNKNRRILVGIARSEPDGTR